MPTRDVIELTAYWGSGDAESTVNVSVDAWEKIKAGARFEVTSKSYYEGEPSDVIWSFLDGTVSIDGDDGMQCVAGLTVENLIRRTLKPSRTK